MDECISTSQKHSAICQSDSGQWKLIKELSGNMTDMRSLSLCNSMTTKISVQIKEVYKNEEESSYFFISSNQLR